MRPTKPYRDDLIRDLKDPRTAASYLNAVLAGGDERAFLIALKDVVDARGVSSISRLTNIHRTHLYRMLSSGGNPTILRVSSLLKSLGLFLGVTSDQPKHQLKKVLTL